MQERQVAAGPAERDVCMPVAAAEEPRAVRLLAHLQDLRQPVGAQHTLVGVVHEQGAEVTDAVAELPWGQILILDDQYEVLGDGRAKRGEGLLVQGVAQSHARQDRADVGSDRVQ